MTWEGLLVNIDGLKFALDLTVKSTLILLAAWAVAWVLRHASAAIRHWVWSFALFGVLMLPGLSLVLPSWQLPILPDVASIAADTALDATSTDIVSETSTQPSLPTAKVEQNTNIAASTETNISNQTEAPVSNKIIEPKAVQPPVVTSSPITIVGRDAAPNRQTVINRESKLHRTPVVIAQNPAEILYKESAQPPVTVPSTNSDGSSIRGTAAFEWNWMQIAFGIWVAGFALIMGRLLLGLAWVQWMSRKAVLVKDVDWLTLLGQMTQRMNIKRTVRLWQGIQPSSPMTWGTLRPVVLLPQEAIEWPEEKRRVVLLHELAHVKRKDTLTQMMAQTVCALFWFNPLVWVAARHLRVEREHACDDTVLQLGTRASEYATYLLDIARTLRSTRVASLATIAMARRSQLEGRLLSILNPGKNRRSLTPVLAICLGLVMLVVLVPLASIQPWAPLPSQTFGGSVESGNALPPQPSADTIIGLVGSRNEDQGQTSPVSSESVNSSADYDYNRSDDHDYDHNADHNHDYSNDYNYEYNYNYDYDYEYDYDFEQLENSNHFIVINEYIKEINRLQLEAGPDSASHELTKELEQHIQQLITQAERLLRLTTVQLNKLALKFETGEEDVIEKVKQHVRESAAAYRITMRNMSKAFDKLDNKFLTESQANAIVQRIQTELEDEINELDNASGNLIDAIDLYVEIHLKQNLGDLGELIAEALQVLSNEIKIEISIEIKNLLLNLELFDLHAGSRVIRIGDKTIIVKSDSDLDVHSLREKLRSIGHDININISVDDIEAELEDMLEDLDETLEEVFEDVGEAVGELMQVFFHKK